MRAGSHRAASGLYRCQAAAPAMRFCEESVRYQYVLQARGIGATSFDSATTALSPTRLNQKQGVEETDNLAKRPSAEQNPDLQKAYHSTMSATPFPQHSPGSDNTDKSALSTTPSARQLHGSSSPRPASA